MKNKKKKEFSKVLLIQESVLMWILTIVCLILAFFCVWNGYTASLPWLSALVGLPYAAYGVSQACYYNKSKAENTVNGIKYETTLRSLGETATEEPVLDYYYSNIEDLDTYQI